MMLYLRYLRCTKRRLAACSRFPRLGSAVIYPSLAVPPRFANFAHDTSGSLPKQGKRDSGEKHKDLLRSVFDHEPSWTALSESYAHNPSSSGLIGNRYLADAKGFLGFSADSKLQCERIIRRVLSASSIEENIAIPRLLDLLSDSLCRVLDLADFIRTMHRDESFREAASMAFNDLWEYMNLLNTSSILKDKLEACFKNPSITQHWTNEEYTVARNLLNDFSKSAIDMPPETRRKFVLLSNDIKTFSHKFIDGLHSIRDHVNKQDDDMELTDAALLTTSNNGVEVNQKPRHHHTASKPQRHLAEARPHKFETDSQRSHRRQVKYLEALLKARHQLASLSHHPDYATMVLSDKMVRTPEAVQSFLQSLIARNKNRGRVNEEADCIRRKGIGHELMIDLSAKGISSHFSGDKTLSSTDLPSMERFTDYFSLGSVMVGVSHVFEHLFGFRLVPSAVSPNEIWDPSVRRLDAIHEDQGLIAMIYCDFFHRPGKSRTPAHYTLRSSRKIQYRDLLEAEDFNDDGMPRRLIPGAGGLFQVPAIAIVLDFDWRSPGANPPLLSHSNVQTIFHEMGHAMHSVLARTDFQIVSGTRCATDLAEIPSILMEYLANDAAVLKKCSRHWKTGCELTIEDLAIALKAASQHEESKLESQILQSLLDQAYHSNLLADPHFDSTKTFRQIYAQYRSAHKRCEVTPQSTFGHLIEYGGLYYSYLFDQVIASKIWRDVLNSGIDGSVFDRAIGDRLSNHFLKHGGAKDPWHCLADLLDCPMLADGGPKAMAEVGQWTFVGR